MDRKGKPHANMEALDAQETKQSKQRASIKWLLSKAFNNRVPENLQEPFYRDHEEQEHLKPPIVGGLANAELYCLALANMYSDPNYHNLNHWNILQTLARKGVQVPDPPDCALTETVLIQTNPLRMSAHLSVMEAMMVLYAREVVTADRVSAAAQRFGGGGGPLVPAGSAVPHEDGLIGWINAACAALNRSQSEDESQVPTVKSLQELCDGTALAALISFYCPDALPRSEVRVGRVSSLQDCLHNLMLVHEFCQRYLPHNVFHMMPEDVTYMRGSMRQNLIAMLADLFNMLEVHPVKCVKYPEFEGTEDSNEHGVRHKRCLPPPPPTPIPDLRPGLEDNQSTTFQVPRSPSACALSRSRVLTGRSACSTPERRSSSPHREEFVVHRGRAVATLSSIVRQNDDRGGENTNMTAAGRPSNWDDNRGTYAGRRSRRNSISDDSQLTVENFGGSQDHLNFCGRNPEKELATLSSARKISAPAGEFKSLRENMLNKDDFRGSFGNLSDNRSGTIAGRRSRRNSISDDSQLTVENFGGHQNKLEFIGKNPEKELATLTPRKMSAPAAPFEANLPVRSSKQDIRGSIQFFHGDFQNGSSPDDRHRPIERQQSQPQTKQEPGHSNMNNLRRQQSSERLATNQNHGNMSNQGGGDGFFLNSRDVHDGDAGNKLEFYNTNKGRANGDQSGLQQDYNDIDMVVEEPPQRKKSTSFATLPNTTTWQQQFMQQENQPNGDGDQLFSSEEVGSGGAMAVQLNNIRLKLEEKRRRIEQEKRRMEVSLNRQRQQVGHQAFLQAVTRSKGGKPDEQQSAPEAAQAHNTQDMGEAHGLDHKWQDKANAPFTETRRTPDLDGMNLEEYQQSIARMNTSLQDIQTDIARVASQQQQLQANQIFEPQQTFQPSPQPAYRTMQQQNIPQLHQQYSSQHNVSSVPRQPSLHNSSFGSTPHIPHEYQQYRQDQHQQRPDYKNSQQYDYHDRYQEHAQEQYGSPRQFFLHDNPPLPLQPPPQPQVQPPRRTWAQQAQMQQENMELRGWQVNQLQVNNQYQQQQQFHEPPQRTWKSPSPQPPQDRNWNPQGFVLHDRTNQPNFPVHYNSADRYQNGTENRTELNQHNHLSYTVINPSPNQNFVSQSQSPPPSHSPQRMRSTPRQASVTEQSRRPDSINLQQLKSPVPAPPVDEMEPQNISFIGNAEDDALRQGINRLHISSGTRTYRIPSPTRPSLSRDSFQHPVMELSQDSCENEQNEKGFYISFDNEQPKRSKPPLRPKRMSPKKERAPSEYQSPEREHARELSSPWQERRPAEEEFVVHRNISSNQSEPKDQEERLNYTSRDNRPPNKNNPEPAALVIGQVEPDPNSAEEMERKKERIMLLSLQRRQRAEEARARGEAATAARRAREEAVAEQRAARKEEQARRRDQILHQYKLKKALEEAEREGKVFDKTELLASLQTGGGGAGGGGSAGAGGGAARLRGKAAGGARARPKTIHVDSGAVHAAADTLLARKQPSSTNLNAYGQGSSTMRRDYYRGSQDSLAERSAMYTARRHNTSQELVTNTPVDECRVMSPSGSSNSALGRRGSYKTSRERVNEVEPQAVRGRSKYGTYQNNFKAGRKSSSLMNLCGPRLYKQPASKSNRGIMLNAVEYCVFPGAVNKEAKRRVLDEIARSEAKHFLVLFRDAGCQFRALYSYCPDTDHVAKLYGTGPKTVNDRMFDKFFKYNSGSKCFSQIHTKHLTVTIDAFTIHNSLWQGKKVQLPSKKDMALVI